jgi:hypothetical protein
MEAIPLSVQFGRVVDAETGTPLKGVRIIAIDGGVPRYNFSPAVEETVTDSLGKYDLTLQGSAWVAYIAPGYETARMVYPAGLVECDSCCGKLKDVRLGR